MASRDITALPPTPGVSSSSGAPHASPALPVLARLLAAADGVEQEAAWAAFVAAHTGLLLHTCQSMAHDRDAVMDGYAYILEALRVDGFRRLRAYTPTAGTQFTTWLVVVARRLLLDHHRQRYGRPRSNDEASRADHAARRRLEDLVAAELDADELHSAAEMPDAAVMRDEVSAALREALASLEPSDRMLLALRFADERPMRVIAATLGMPTVFHVYRRLAAVLALLKRSLAQRRVEPPNR